MPADPSLLALASAPEELFGGLTLGPADNEVSLTLRGGSCCDVSILSVLRNGYDETPHGPFDREGRQSLIPDAERWHHGIFRFFTTAEATELRLVCREFVDGVAVTPFFDMQSCIFGSVLDWRASFPAATAANLSRRRAAHALVDADFEHLRTRAVLGGAAPLYFEPPSSEAVDFARFRWLLEVDASWRGFTGDWRSSPPPPEGAARFSDAALAHLRGVRSLRLRGYARRLALTEAGLGNLRGIASLDLCCTQLTQRGAAGVARLAGLRDLNVSTMPGAAWVSDATLLRLRGLRSADLGGQALVSAEGALASLRGAVALNVRESGIVRTRLSASVLERLRGVESLEGALPWMHPLIEAFIESDTPAAMRFLNEGLAGAGEALRRLLVRVTDDKGTTLLHVAAMKGLATVTRALIAAGADCNALSAGRSPLFGACSGGYTLVVSALLDAGTRASAADLDAALRFPSIVAMLKARGAKPDAKIDEPKVLLGCIEKLRAGLPTANAAVDALKALAHFVDRVAAYQQHADVDERRRAAAAAALPDLLAALRAHHLIVPAVCQWGCSALASIAGVGPEGATALEAAGAVPLCAAVVERWCGVDSVACGEACLAIALVASGGGAAGRAAAVACGAVGHVVAALRTASSEPKMTSEAVASYASMALANISSCGDAEGGDAAVAAGAVPQLIAALQCHANKAIVCKMASRAIANLALSPVGRSDAAASAIALAAPALVAALARHINEADVCAYASDALACLACCAAGREAALLAGALSQLVEVLRVHADKAHVCQCASWALLNVSFAEPAHRAEALAAGAAQVLSDALARHGDDRCSKAGEALAMLWPAQEETGCEPGAAVPTAALLLPSVPTGATTDPYVFRSAYEAALNTTRQSYFF